MDDPDRQVLLFFGSPDDFHLLKSGPGNTRLWPDCIYATGRNEFESQLAGRKLLAAIVDATASSPADLADILSYAASVPTLVLVESTACPPPNLPSQVSIVAKTTALLGGLPDIAGLVVRWGVECAHHKDTSEQLFRLQLLQEQAGQLGGFGYWQWDIKAGCYSYCSEELAHMFEMTVDEYIRGSTATEMDVQGVHPDDRRRYQRTIRDARDKNVAYEMEYRVLTKSGVVRYLSVAGAPVFDQLGVQISSFGTAQDITSRKLNEESLRKSDLLFRQAERLGQLGYWEWDFASGKMASCSAQYAHIVGLTVQEAIVVSNSEQADLLLVHPEDRELYSRAAYTEGDDSAPYEVDYRIVTPAGEVRHVREICEEARDDGDGRLVSQFGILQDLTERRRLSERLDYEIRHDQLTGLLNRRAFEQRLQRQVDELEDSKETTVLCYIDLDQFKLINDSCGLLAADQMLKQLSRTLLLEAEQPIDLGRLGGDEFVLLLKVEDSAAASARAEQVLSTIEGFHFSWGGGSYKLSASIGLVHLQNTAVDAVELLNLAIGACHLAKEQGGGRVHQYRQDDPVTQARWGETQWANLLHQALEQNAFQLFYQDISPTSGEKSIGRHFEILLRLKDDEGNLQSPSNFLSAAERFHLFPRLDVWVINKLLSFLEQQTAITDTLACCAVNLSGISIGDEQFQQFVFDRMQRSTVPANKICFEITETAAIANLEPAQGFIQKMKALGCSFALDDFGSGLSSFAYLKTLPVDYLKIDGFFVKDIVNDPIDFAMVKSINDIGKLMGKKTIAEFVENEEILAMIASIGVDFAQGYGISRPRPIEDLLI
ncbi:MAG: EAL domain-containing protein [Pseudomonadales bacterium]